MKISDVILKDETPASQKICRQVQVYEYLGDPPPYPISHRWLYSDRIKKQEREWRPGKDKVLVRDLLTQEIFPVRASQIKYKAMGEEGKEEAILFVEREAV